MRRRNHTLLYAIALVALGCLSMGLLATAGVAKPHGKHFTPKPGRYVVVGAAKIGAHTYEMRMVFLFKDDTISDVTILNNFPGCSQGSGSVSGPVVSKRFKLVNSGTFPSSRVIKGRFTSATDLKGAMSVTYPGPSQCGQAGSYVYDWTGKRTGKPT